MKVTFKRDPSLKKDEVEIRAQADSPEIQSLIRELSKRTAKKVKADRTKKFSSTHHSIFNVSEIGINGWMPTQWKKSVQYKRSYMRLRLYQHKISFKYQSLKSSTLNIFTILS